MVHEMPQHGPSQTYETEENSEDEVHELWAHLIIHGARQNIVHGGEKSDTNLKKRFSGAMLFFS